MTEEKTNQPETEEISPFDILEPYVDKSAVLTPDQRAVVLRELREDLFATKHLFDTLSGETLDVDLGLARTVLSLKEQRLCKLSKTLNISLDTVEEQERRYALLRQANERVRELEAKLGEKGSVEEMCAMLRRIEQKLNDWWDTQGFGLISSIRFHPGGTIHLECSCSLYGNMRGLTGMSDTPVSEKEAHAQWIESLKQCGFDIYQSSDRRDHDLLDTDNNRQLLLKLFRDSFPSVRFLKAETRYHHNVGLLKSIEMYILQPNDVHRLV